MNVTLPIFATKAPRKEENVSFEERKYKINPINHKPGWIPIGPSPANKYIVYAILIKYYSESKIAYQQSFCFGIFRLKPDLRQ